LASISGLKIVIVLRGQTVGVKAQAHIMAPIAVAVDLANSRYVAAFEILGETLKIATGNGNQKN